MIIWCIAIVRRNVVIDPRIPTMPADGACPVFTKPGRHCALGAVKCPTSRMKSELHPNKNRGGGGGGIDRNYKKGVSVTLDKEAVDKITMTRKKK